jgi:hypothetical protein
MSGTGQIAKFRGARTGIAPLVALAGISVWAIAPAHAQTTAAATPCFEVVIEKDQNGKALLRVPIKVISIEADGSRTLVQIDPQCLNELAAHKPPVVQPASDKYAMAQKGVDTALDAAKKNGLSDEDAEKIGTRLKAQLDKAKQDKADPETRLSDSAGSAAKDASDSGDKSTAILAGVAVVAGACIVASAGFCTAIAAAILPSILPASVTSQDVAGVVRAVQSANKGEPVNPADIESAVKILGAAGKLSPSQQDIVRAYLTDPPKAVVKLMSTNLGITEANADSVLTVIRSAIDAGKAPDCQVVRKAFGADVIPVTANINAEVKGRIIRSVERLPGGQAAKSEIATCLDTILHVQ